jgi:hypothetical protein
VYYLKNEDGSYVIKHGYVKLNVPKIVVHISIASLILISLMMVGCPPYNVWQQGLVGEAELRRAEQNRMILVEQAKAERDAATQRAEAIAIVGQAAQDFPEYRLQEFLGSFAEALNSESIDKIIFVPTEANIPITEAGRTVAKNKE